MLYILCIRIFMYDLSEAQKSQKIKNFINQSELFTKSDFLES